LLPAKRFGVLHAMHMCAVMSAASATSEFAWAHKLIDEWWPRYLKSVVHRSAYLGIVAHSEHARMLLNERVASGDFSHLEKLVAGDLRALEASGLRLHGTAAAQALRARLAYLQGDAERAITLLRAAIAALDEAGLRPDAASARRALGRLLTDQARKSGGEGAENTQAADVQLAKCGVRNPHDFCARYYPELTQTAQQTPAVQAEVRETG
jgi:hypothetical protein